MKEYYSDSAVTIYHGSALEVLRQLPPGMAHTCITSPPYWGLRDYGVEGQLGLEKTPEEYVGKLADIFDEVKRLLREDGTLWLNLGDSYAGSGKGDNPNGKQGTSEGTRFNSPTSGAVPLGLKPKDLVGIPWMVAFELRRRGWYLRSDIIWAKPNPMPESVTDRPTKSHEYIFLLAKNRDYYYDAEAIKERAIYSAEEQAARLKLQKDGMKSCPNGIKGGIRPRNSDLRKGGSIIPGKGEAHKSGTRTGANLSGAYKGADWNVAGRNKRSVWTVTTKPYREAHFATFPPDLITPCVLAGAPAGGIVLDPFMGSGTTAWVAKEHGRKAWGIELNAKYIDMAARRVKQEVLDFGGQ